MLKIVLLTVALTASSAFANSACLDMLHRSRLSVTRDSHAWLVYNYTQDGAFRDFLIRIAGVTDHSGYRADMTDQVLEIISNWTAKDRGDGRMSNFISLITLPERKHINGTALLEAKRIVKRWRQKFDDEAFLPLESFFDEPDVVADLKELNNLIREPNYFVTVPAR